jgi:UDP-glucuronate decarboxylase
MKKILVTGGAGFLGSHLCEELLARGNEVLCVDNFFTGQKRNLSHLANNPRFECLRHDVTLPLQVEVQEIYNLACPAAPVPCRFDPVQTGMTCVHGAVNLLGLARRTQARLLHASSGEVYGNPTVHPQSESYWGHVNPVGPRCSNQECKRCAESLCLSFHRQHKVAVRVARIFNTFGPRMPARDGRAVSTFINQALDGKPLTVHGEGTQIRSFCYVDDLVAGLIALMEAPGECVGPMNLGSPEPIPVLELAEQVLKLTRSRSRIVFQPRPEEDPDQRHPDVALAKAALGWEPTVSLEVGLQRTIEFFAWTRKNPEWGQLPILLPMRRQA